MPLRVLIVDDEELARLRLRALIEDCAEPRATVVGEAANATQALVWLQSHGQGPTAPRTDRACDLVLLDIQMPGMDGFEVLAHLRADPLTRHVPVIAVSANARPDDLERARAAGFDAYLTKPVDLEVLLRTVRSALAGAERS